MRYGSEGFIVRKSQEATAPRKTIKFIQNIQDILQKLGQIEIIVPIPYLVKNPYSTIIVPYYKLNTDYH